MLEYIYFQQIVIGFEIRKILRTLCCCTEIVYDQLKNCELGIISMLCNMVMYVMTSISDKLSADKIFDVKIFRRTKFSAPNLALLSAENVLCIFFFFNMSLIWLDMICWYRVLNFSRQDISADKISGGQNSSADTIFGSKLDFQHFRPPKFCQSRYVM